jgi:3-carboxy-cis,cis-muconate cycloisomerase
VRDASLRAAASVTLADALDGVETGLTDAELRDALDPTTYLGSAGALVDRALARYGAEREER